MSKVEVDQVTQQSGTTLTVGGGACKTAVVDATTVTLGRCGGTVSLASGATQSGFGRTGTVDWQTTIQTGDFTAVSGQGYFINTTSGGITMTLPASPSVGDIVSCKDYAYNFGTNALTIGLNGSNLGGGSSFNPTFDTDGAFLTFIYADASKGWLLTDEANNTSDAANIFIVASGGNQPTPSGCIVDTNYKFHKFTSPGTFTISAGSGPVANVDYMVVAGGGGSGGSDGGNWGGAAGGGAGGYRESKVTATSGCWTASPLAAATSLPISVTSYPIAVGGGGSGGVGGPDGTGVRGTDSTFSTITSTGGGGGLGTTPARTITCTPGGSGGGMHPPQPAAGNGNNPPTTPPQGEDGGSTSSGAPAYSLGAGGGATQTGQPHPSSSNGAAGGAGATNTIDGTPTARAGGGGSGAASGNTAGPGGTGGGGAGGSGPSNGNIGVVNTGGGAGGAAATNTSPLYGSTGGSGIVIIRYKFQ